MALTNVAPERDDVAFIEATGPFKREIKVVTSDGTDDDTFVSKLQRILAVSIRVANSDLGGTASGVSATFSGKTVTLRNPANTVTYIVEVIGF